MLLPELLQTSWQENNISNSEAYNWNVEVKIEPYKFSNLF